MPRFLNLGLPTFGIVLIQSFPSILFISTLSNVQVIYSLISIKILYTKEKPILIQKYKQDLVPFFSIFINFLSHI